MTNLLKNPSFEGIDEPGEWTRDTHSGVAYGEIYVPIGWTAWWEEGEFKRPECKVIHNQVPFLDPPRICDGQWAWQVFTMFGRQHAGLYQVVENLLPGKVYRFTAKAHAWSAHTGILAVPSANCSAGVGCGPVYLTPDQVPPLGDPPGSDPLNDAIGNFALCLAVGPAPPDPFSDQITWGDVAHIYNGYFALPALEFVAPADGVATVYLKAYSLWDFKTSDAYWDDAWLVLKEGEPPPDDGRGQPRMQYRRTYVLMPPVATKDDWHAAVDRHFDDRHTLGGSADDGGIGDLDERKVVAVAPGSWPGGEAGLRAFYAEYYPGVNFEVEGDSGNVLLWQCDLPWKDHRYAGGRCDTVCAKGCWIVDCAMAQRYLGIDPNATPLTVDEAVGSAGYNTNCEMTWDAMPALGLEVVKRSSDDTEAKAWLAQGDICFAEVQPTSLLHHVLVTQCVENRYWMFDPWKNVQCWLDEQYAGVESWRLVRKYQASPPPPILTEQLISLHLQKRVQHDIEYAEAVKPSVLKTVLNMEFLRAFKAVSPNTLMIYRQYLDDQGQYWSDSNPNRGARRFLETFLASLEANADVVDFVESLNETIATDDVAGIRRTVEFDVAFCEELEKAMGDSVHPAILTAAVGNPQHGAQTRMLIPAAKACVAHKGVLCYHGYSYYPGYDHFGSDWRHHAGRGLESWDVEFRAAGVYPRYVFTECGVCATAHAGWKHRDCMDGDLDEYIHYLLELKEKLNEWNAIHGGRCLGATLFTSGGGSLWRSFNLAGHELERLSAALLQV